MRPSLAAALLCAAPLLALGQSFGENDPDWREVDAPHPAPLRIEKLISVDFQNSGTVRWGVDPASITIGADKVVRYVVVAQAPGGPPNAMYEGIRCATGEMKTYARHSADGGWKPVVGSQWESVREGSHRHTLYIARYGACTEHTPNGSVPQIIRDLSASVDTRYRTDTLR